MNRRGTVPGTESEIKHQDNDAEVRVQLEPDLLGALDRLVGEHGTTRPEALLLAFREWAGERGYLSGEEGLRPEDLNASNDD